jgi:uncharacterized protein
MITASPHTAGATFPVRGQPNARKNAVVGEHNGAVKVAVTAPPEDGKANAAILDVLAEWLGVKRSQLELISAPSNRNKTFLVRGAAAEHLTATLNSRLSASADD